MTATPNGKWPKLNVRLESCGGSCGISDYKANDYHMFFFSIIYKNEHIYAHTHIAAHRHVYVQASSIVQTTSRN